MVYKKKCFISFIICILLIILFTSCSDSNVNQYVFCSSAIKFNRTFVTNEDYIFTFYVPLLAKNIDDKIEFDSFEGENINDISVTFIDNTFGDESPKKIDGYYLRKLTLRCHTNEDNIRIDKAYFWINDEKYEVSFDHPIKATRVLYNSKDYQSGLYCLESTAVAPTAVLKTSQKLDYLITSNCNIVVTEIDILDFINISDSLVVCNDIPLGKLEDVLPLEVNKNDQYRIWLSFDYDKDTKTNSSYYDNILTTISFKYALLEMPEKVLRCDMSLSFDGLFDDQCAEEFVKLNKPNK